MKNFSFKLISDDEITVCSICTSSNSKSKLFQIHTSLKQIENSFMLQAETFPTAEA